MANETTTCRSPREKTIWFAVLLSESAVIVTVNAFTIVTFARNRSLRKRNTYLIMNQTVADFLVGAVTGPLEIWYPAEKGHNPGFSWKHFSITFMYDLFVISSLTNLSLIALERLHATLSPFKHCYIEELFYFKIIIYNWILALLLSFVDTFLYLDTSHGSYYLWTSLIVLTLLILTVSYTIVVVKIKSSQPPRPFSAVALDRKLSVTLFIVTAVSVLTILPYAIYAIIPLDMTGLSKRTQFHIELVVYVLYYACSLVNPLIYAIRMRGFRKAVYRQLACGKVASSRRHKPIELHSIRMS